MKNENIPVSSAMMTTEEVKLIAKNLQRGAQCTVDFDKEAGTITIKDGPTIVLNGIQKGFNQPWIVMYYNSENIIWRSDPAKIADN